MPALIEAYPGSTVTEGVITERIFSDTDTTVTFVVTQEDDTQVSFKVDLSNPPTLNGTKPTVPSTSSAPETLWRSPSAYNEVTPHHSNLLRAPMSSAPWTASSRRRTATRWR